ncbi:MAG: hypothetical protein AAF766_10120 [Cyanobacteria bacterium P01_D01_bin.14]
MVTVKKIGLAGFLGSGVLLAMGIAFRPNLAAAIGFTDSAPAISAPAPTEDTPRIVQRRRFEDYQQVIERTRSMIYDSNAIALAQQWGLNILDITWEDTGRYDNSAVGPNISDMTIQVQHRHPDRDDYMLSLMPVIRHPNFSDLTGDIPIDDFYVLTGNEKGEDLQEVPLKDLLGNIRNYLSEPDSWAGRETSLLAERDSHVLVSAQACFLPIPAGQEAVFNPVLFNYQSYPGDPAVLTILATREGTSITVIDNQRDAFEAGRTWGQRLFFNQNGERASLTGQRLSDFQAEPSEGGSEATGVEASEESLNMVMLIQVPLKQKEPFLSNAPEAMPAPLADFDGAVAASSERSNVESAVIGHGEVEGPFTEIDNLAIERDPNFPIRVTVQFYKATSNGVVSEADMLAINEQIERVYEEADYVGSLVLDGRRNRPTEYEGEHTEPDDWWEQFWQHSQGRLDMTEAEAEALLRRLRGQLEE